MLLDNNYALYCPLKRNYPANSGYSQRVIVTGSNIHSSAPALGQAIIFWFKLESLPNGFNSILVRHGGTHIGGGGGDNFLNITINTSNRLSVVYRISAGRTITSGVLTTGVWYLGVFNYHTGSGAKLWVNTTSYSNSNDCVEHKFSEEYYLLAARNGASGTNDNFNGWFKNFRRFVGCGMLDADDIAVLYGNGTGAYVEEANLPEALQGTCVTDIRFNQRSGSTVYDNGILRPSYMPRYLPINFNVAPELYSCEGGGRWVDVSPPPVEDAPDFDIAYTLSVLNAVPSNYQDNEELTVLAHDYVVAPVERHQFKATTANGSYIRGNVPMSDNMVIKAQFSTHKTSSANLVSLPSGQSNGLAIWCQTTNRWSISFFHSGGTQEINLLEVGEIPGDRSIIDFIFVIWDNGANRTVRIFVDGDLIKTFNTNRSIDGLNFQLGQYQNNLNTGLNHGSPDADEGLHKFDMWYIVQDTSPTDGQILALDYTTIPTQTITKNNVTGVTGMPGYLRYNPLFFDDSGTTKYPVYIDLHGAGDGQNTSGMTLTALSQRTTMNWLKANNVPFICISPWNTNGDWTATEIDDLLDYFLDPSTGILKNYVDYTDTLINVSLSGYSAGAIGICRFWASSSGWRDRIKVYICNAANAFEAYTYGATMVGKGAKCWFFCVDNDAVTSAGSVRAMAAEFYDADPDSVRITQFTEFDSGTAHTVMQDMVYNNVGTLTPQTTGTYTEGGDDYPFYEWTVGTSWNWVLQEMGL